MRIDLATQRAERAGRRLDLTAKEQALLVLFLRHPGEVLSRTRIYEHVWDERYDGLSNTLEVHVMELRRKLEAHGPRLIHTRRGRGYIFEEAGHDADDAVVGVLSRHAGGGAGRLFRDAVCAGGTPICIARSTTVWKRRSTCYRRRPRSSRTASSGSPANVRCRWSRRPARNLLSGTCATTRGRAIDGSGDRADADALARQESSWRVRSRALPAETARKPVQEQTPSNENDKGREPIVFSC